MRRPAGLTLIEVILSSAIFAGVISVAFAISIAATRSMNEGTEYIRSGIAGAKVMDRLSEDLANAEYGTITLPSTPYGVGTCIQFRKVESYIFPTKTTPGGFVYEGGVNRFYLYRWVPLETFGDNIDNNDNGIIDEGYIVREQRDIITTPSSDTLISSEVITTNCERTGLVLTQLDPVSIASGGSFFKRVRIFYRNYYYVPNDSNANNTNTDRMNGQTRKKANFQDYQTVVNTRN